MTTQKPQILIIKHGALGDIVLATGAMKAIRARHPEAEITLLTTRPYDALMKDCPYIDRILIDEKPKIWQWKKLKALKALLQSQHWLWVYDLQTSQRSTCYFPLLKTQFYSGLSPKGSHPHLTPERTRLHTLDRLAQQLEITGISNMSPPDVSWLDAPLPDDTALNGHFVIFVAGGAPHRPAKRWPHYAELAKQLLKMGYTPVLIGTTAEEAILKEIASADESIVNLMGKTSFAQIATLACRASYAVGNDTGPMHLIAAAGCPCTVIFNMNESRPEKSAPRGERVTIVQAEDLNEIDAESVRSAVTAAKPGVLDAANP